MTSTREDLRSLLEILPEWRANFASLNHGGESAPVTTTVSGITLLRETLAILQRIGPSDMYSLLLKRKDKRLSLIFRNLYFIPLAEKMVLSSVNLRRFSQERRIDRESLQAQATSMAVEVAIKLESALQKHLDEGREDGFRVLLPAYAQSTVNNAVIDHIKNECQWERSLCDAPREEGEDDPIERTADESKPNPEQLALSREKVGHLNAFRKRLKSMLEGGEDQDGALTVIDCLFGLGLTPNSRAGEEMTMRECCDKLNVQGETQARKIARCQVLLDKGLERIRSTIRENLPGITECFQTEININVASRRELNHQLGLTEGEIERLILNRQFQAIEELAQRAGLKQERMNTIITSGAVAAFVPVDINSAPSRDLMDILGMDKTSAKTVVDKRPFAELVEISRLLSLSEQDSLKLVRRGAVLKKPSQRGKSFNSASEAELLAVGLPQEKVAALLRARPFSKWADIEDFLLGDQAIFGPLKENFYLLANSS
jgi:hypothetical protein